MREMNYLVGSRSAPLGLLGAPGCIYFFPLASAAGGNSEASALLLSQALQATDGWHDLEARRRAKFTKSIAGGAMMSPKGMDEGADR